MDNFALFIFVFWTAVMTSTAIDGERDRAMLFPDYYFFAERRLVNHTVEEKRVKNLDDCELLCYLNENCVSLNFKKDPDDNLENNSLGHSCELNNANHLEYDGDLKTDAVFYYRGSKNACSNNSMCQNNATCQSGFTFKGYRCLCPLGFEGERCEKDTDECKTTPQKCHVNAACNNTHGSYVCTCKPGYVGDGRDCADIDECNETYAVKRNKCHLNASCINTQGSYNCSCNPNYVGDGFNCEADPCYNYKSLSDADRKSNHQTPQYQEVCDNSLPEGWYRFVGAAGTKMPTTRVPAYRCGTNWSGWLMTAHPTLEDGEVLRTVCFSDRSTGCKYSNEISVKNCGSYFIYEFFQPPGCDSRYCSTD
nr:uromodulin-like [Pocillopora verrucosa]